MPVQHDLNEKETRAELIDPLLVAAENGATTSLLKLVSDANTTYRWKWKLFYGV